MLLSYRSPHMAILISPSNNTGWGLLGRSAMFGGAKEKSDAHPVFVQSHYRAKWGSLHRSAQRKPRRKVIRLPLDPATAAQVDATIEEVVRGGPAGTAAVIAASRAMRRRKRRYFTGKRPKRRAPRPRL